MTSGIGRQYSIRGAVHDVAFARNRAREPVNWRATVGPIEGAEPARRGLHLLSPLFGSDTEPAPVCESTPARPSKSTQQPFTVRVKCHSATLAQATALIADRGTRVRDLVGVILRERSAAVSTLQQA